MLSPETIIGICTGLGGAAVVALKYVFRGELARFWLRLQGPEGFVPRREYHIAHGDLKRRVKALEEAQ